MRMAEVEIMRIRMPEVRIVDSNLLRLRKFMRLPVVWWLIGRKIYILAEL
jgi:hypothetical protein